MHDVLKYIFPQSDYIVLIRHPPVWAVFINYSTFDPGFVSIKVSISISPSYLWLCGEGLRAHLTRLLARAQSPTIKPTLGHRQELHHCGCIDCWVHFNLFPQPFYLTCCYVESSGAGSVSVGGWGPGHGGPHLRGEAVRPGVHPGGYLHMWRLPLETVPQESKWDQRRHVCGPI